MTNHNVPKTDIYPRNNINLYKNTFSETDWTNSHINNILWIEKNKWSRKKIPILKELKYNSLEELEKILKNDFDLVIDIQKIIDPKTNKILAEIFKLKETKTFSLVWEIFKSKYVDKNFIWENHLYNVVEKWAKWKWYWKLMFSLYLEYAKLTDNTLIIPDLEYTNIASMINLYEKFWYKVKYQINWKKNKKETLTEENKKLIKKEILSYKNWNLEQKLPFSVVLEKNDNF